MKVKSVKMTPARMRILRRISNASLSDPVYGLKICKDIRCEPSTVYPALARMVEVGWLERHLEEPAPTDRRRRHYYTITPDGRSAYEDEFRKPFSLRRSSRSTSRKGAGA
jgi:DNA-binding PadR family transcriptional regulator